MEQEHNSHIKRWGLEKNINVNLFHLSKIEKGIFGEIAKFGEGTSQNIYQILEKTGGPENSLISGITRIRRKIGPHGISIITHKMNRRLYYILILSPKDETTLNSKRIKSEIIQDSRIPWVGFDGEIGILDKDFDHL